MVLRGLIGEELNYQMHFPQGLEYLVRDLRCIINRRLNKSWYSATKTSSVGSRVPNSKNNTVANKLSINICSAKQDRTVFLLLLLFLYRVQRRADMKKLLAGMNRILYGAMQYTQ